mmetsp:Transcript_14500/g.38813  ORF Transcript_14500/g.38813 Transcript_14500/m.38813 type:complete len:284 (-) Transcript_14500:113-964(-)
MMLAASMAPPPPPVPPAPTSVWISSIIRITSLFESSTSLMTFFRRSSNSPRYLVPARSPARSSWTMRFPCRRSGMSPSEMRWARPSAMAVFPTPGSPMRTGLFFWRRARIWMVRSSSASRPTSGSTLPSAAALVRSVPNSSRVACLPAWAEPPLEDDTPTSCSLSSSFSSFLIASGIFFGSTFSFSSTLAVLPSFSWTRASRICAVQMAFEDSFRASSTASTSTLFALGVNGTSTWTCPEPRPICSSTIFRTSLRLTPRLLRTLAATPEFSATTPTRSISVPT